MTDVRLETQAQTRSVAVPPLDHRAPVLSPVTRRAMGRALGLYAVVWTVATGLAVTGRQPLVDIGASLYLPGGAHLANGHLVHGAVVLASFAVCVLLWWMIGAFAAPLAVWAIDVVAVAVISHGQAGGAELALVAAAVPALLVASFTWHAIRHRLRLRRAGHLNERLAARSFAVTTIPSQASLPVREASVDDLSRLRFALDLALQPLESFAGFDRRDQFREAALRYQLCILGYALSAFQYNSAPAFGGYLTEAHARSIAKMSDRRVWGYWALENAWGRFSLGRDPVANDDNIMLTGWQGASVGMFETLSDDRFSRPGALTYRWSDDEEYPYEFGSLASSIQRNMERSEYTLYSCEPRWIYPVCNTFGVNTLALHDRLHGTTHFDELEDRIRQAYLEEFHRPDGRVVGVRSETLGLSWSPWSGDGVWLPTTYWMHPTMPDLAHRSWWLMRETVLQEDEGRFSLPPSLANRCDSGSYAFGKATFGQVLLAMAAREIGDEEVASSVLDQLDHEETIERSGGAARYTGLSTQGNLYALMARFGRHAGVRDLVRHGLPETWQNGPRLAEAAYPDVLVAKAVTDGRALECVLHPGGEPVRTRVLVDRLRPGGHYVVRGATEVEVVADARGGATLEIDLGGRTELTVEPAP
ncbi:linalool dehydratase/isomerase domain-containing protein [Aeromicrobium sp. Sec7.5]|uniref:linalool dehydratase/isomerase domain-containing protein n=1 Tax=Aeromicrobium sp. Sec7.5 TaxID=3121276 RepID=UPI002FE4A2DC